MKGSLEEFKAWCEGNVPPRGPHGGRHYQALNALQSYQMYLQSLETEDDCSFLVFDETENVPEEIWNYEPSMLSPFIKGHGSG